MWTATHWLSTSSASGCTALTHPRRRSPAGKKTCFHSFQETAYCHTFGCFHDLQVETPSPVGCKSVSILQCFGPHIATSPPYPSITTGLPLSILSLTPSPAYYEAPRIRPPPCAAVTSRPTFTCQVALYRDVRGSEYSCGQRSKEALTAKVGSQVRRSLDQPMTRLWSG